MNWFRPVVRRRSGRTVWLAPTGFAALGVTAGATVGFGLGAVLLTPSAVLAGPLDRLACATAHRTVCHRASVDTSGVWIWGGVAAACLFASAAPWPAPAARVARTLVTAGRTVLTVGGGLLAVFAGLVAALAWIR